MTSSLVTVRVCANADIATHASANLLMCMSIPVAVLGRNSLHVQRSSLPAQISRDKIGDLLQPSRFGARVQQHLAKTQIGQWLREPETQPRIECVDYRQRRARGHRLQFVVSLDGALAQFRRRDGPFVVIEKIHFAAQKSSLVVQRHDFESPPPSRQDIHAAVAVFAQHLVDGRGTAGVDDSFFIRQHHAELLPVALDFAHHFFIAIFEDVQRQIGAGEQDDV